MTFLQAGVRVSERGLSPLSQCWQPVVSCHPCSEKVPRAGQQGDLGIVTLALHALRQCFLCSCLSKASLPAQTLYLGQWGGAGTGGGCCRCDGRAEEPLLEGVGRAGVLGGRQGGD